MDTLSMCTACNVGYGDMCEGCTETACTTCNYELSNEVDG